MKQAVLWSGIVVIIFGGFFLMNIIKTRQADEIKNVVNPVINIPVRETINIPNIELDNDQMPVAENEEEVIENEIIDLEKEEVEINEMIDELESLEF